MKEIEKEYLFFDVNNLLMKLNVSVTVMNKINKISKLYENKTDIVVKNIKKRRAEGMEIRQVDNVKSPYPQTNHQPTAIKEPKPVKVQEQQKVRQDDVQDRVIDKKELSDMVENANQFFNLTKTHLHFVLHEDTNKYYVKIMNSVSNEILKEIPSREFLDMVARMQKFAGVIVDEKI
jgi:flagellar protein FlaG